MEGTKVNRFEIGELTFGRTEWHRMAGRGLPSLFNFLRWREGDKAAEPKLQQKICSFSSLKNQRAEFRATTATGK